MNTVTTDHSSPNKTPPIGAENLSCKNDFDGVSNEFILGGRKLTLDEFQILVKSGKRSKAFGTYASQHEEDEDNPQAVALKQEKVAFRMANAASISTSISNSEIFSFKGHTLTFDQLKDSTQIEGKKIDDEIKKVEKDLPVLPQERATADGRTFGSSMQWEMYIMRNRNAVVTGSVNPDDIMYVDGKPVERAEYRKLQELEEQREQLTQYVIKGQSLAEQVESGCITQQEAQKQMQAALPEFMQEKLVENHIESEQVLAENAAKASEIPLEAPEETVQAQQPNVVTAGYDSTLKPKL